jgi:hypothetical protein
MHRPGSRIVTYGRYLLGALGTHRWRVRSIDCMHLPHLTGGLLGLELDYTGRQLTADLELH